MTNNAESFAVLELGDKFDLFRERFLSAQDGSYFEALEDNGGFMLVTYLGGMTRKEKNALSKEVIRTRMIKEGNKILFLIRYGTTPMIFEISFDPTLYTDKRAMQITFDNHMVCFVGIERTDNTIQTLRMANMPMKLKQALITAWSSAFEEENYSDNYTKWTNNLYQHSTLQLWSNAEEVGYFGEGGLLDD